MFIFTKSFIVNCEFFQKIKNEFLSGAISIPFIILCKLKYNYIFSKNFFDIMEDNEVNGKTIIIHGKEFYQVSLLG